MSIPTEASPAGRKGRPRPPTAVRKGAERVKRTVVLSRDLDVRLGVLAAVRGVDCSTLIAEMIGPHLRGVIVSLRNRAADGCDTLPIVQEVAAA